MSCQVCEMQPAPADKEECVQTVHEVLHVNNISPTDILVALMAQAWIEGWHSGIHLGLTLQVSESERLRGAH